MTAIVIGRFQVPYLHPGHLHLIATALRECEDVIILIGVSNKIDEKNPFSIVARENMIKKIFPHINVSNIGDRPTDKEWSKLLDTYLEGVIEPVLYHSRDSFKEVYTGVYPLREVEEVVGYSGTKIRESLKK